MSVNKHFRRIRRRLFNGTKLLYQTLSPHNQNKAILLIVGCQRSGTTMLSRIFERDLQTKTYRESSSLSSQDKKYKIRLNPADKLATQLENVKPRFVILKPLVESQNANTLLTRLPNSKAVWIYRNFYDVISSNLRKFGADNGIHDLRPIVERQRNNWRAEYVPEDVFAIVQRYFSSRMSQSDAAALFWYVRNRLYFDRQLDEDSRVMLCKYEDLVVQPTVIVRRIYDFAGQRFPGPHILGHAHSRSVGKGGGVCLSPAILGIVTKLQERLDMNYERYSL